MYLGVYIHVYIYIYIQWRRKLIFFIGVVQTIANSIMRSFTRTFKQRPENGTSSGGASMVLHHCIWSGTCLSWTLLGQKKVSWLVRCPDFRGPKVHKQGIWDNYLRPNNHFGCPNCKIHFRYTCIQSAVLYRHCGTGVFPHSTSERCVCILYCTMVRLQHAKWKQEWSVRLFLCGWQN